MRAAGAPGRPEAPAKGPQARRGATKGLVAARRLALLSALVLAALATPAAAAELCESQALPFRPPVRLEVGADASHRWGAYRLASVAVGVEVPLLPWLSVASDARVLTAGKEPIWLHDFESTTWLVIAGGGLRLRAEHPRSAVAPIAELAFYGIARVELGLRAAGGADLYFDPDHRVGLRLQGGASFSPGRPPAPEVGGRFVIALGGGRDGRAVLAAP